MNWIRKIEKDGITSKLEERVKRLEDRFFDMGDIVSCAVCGVLLRKSFAKEVDTVKVRDWLLPYGFATRKYIDTKYFCQEHAPKEIKNESNTESN